MKVELNIGYLEPQILEVPDGYKLKVHTEIVKDPIPNPKMLCPHCGEEIEYLNYEDRGYIYGHYYPAGHNGLEEDYDENGLESDCDGITFKCPICFKVIISCDDQNQVEELFKTKEEKK